MSDTTVYVTQDTFDKMREQLQKMKSVERPAASRAIGEAREKGERCNAEQQGNDYDTQANHRSEHLR